MFPLSLGEGAVRKSYQLTLSENIVIYEFEANKKCQVSSVVLKYLSESFLVQHCISSI